MTPYRFRNAVRITLGVAALLILGLAIAAFPESAAWPGWPEALVTALVIAFIVNYSIPMPVGEGSLVHLVSLGNILVYSPLSITAVVAAGVLLGDVVRSVWRRGPSYRDMPLSDRRGPAEDTPSPDSPPSTSSACSASSPALAPATTRCC